MKRGRVVAAASVSAVAAAMTVPSAAMGASSAAPLEREPLQQLSLDARDGKIGDFTPAALARDALVTVMVEVQGEPVAAAQADAQEAGAELSQERRAQMRATIRERQEPVRRGVRALRGTVLSEVQDAFNGVKVRVPRSSLAEVAALPNVAALHPVPTYEPTHETSVPFLGIPQEVWEDHGLTGEGITVGVIDTGIDYTHAMFGGPGTEEAYEENNPAIVEPGTFPTAKVVGGFDFVGNTYDASAEPGDPALVPRPDPDPLDCHGHGTHVAGTAAGMGVLPDGSTYTGPYGASTFEQDFQVGPGVAPEALLYALKVFGCAGSTDVTIEAVDWAVEHGLDVINLSLGSAFSVPDDALDEAINNAARAGTIPVISAGNDADVPYIVGSPSTAERAISVAAIDSTPSFPGALLEAGDADLVLQVSNGVEIPEPISGELVVLEDDPETPADESLGCAAADYAGILEGAIVLTYRGVCARVDRAVLGQQAGAAAVIMVNDSPGLPPFEGPIENVTIPFLGATPEQGEQLAGLDGETVAVSAAGPIPNPGARQPAGFTSAGPALVGDAAKPDLAAPGVGIVSAGVGTGNGAATLSGTSMAAPHVAGIAALVREARPEDPVETLKAAIINTADPARVEGYTTLRVGAGLVDADEAIETPVVAFGASGTASLSYGFVESEESVTRTETVTLRNTSRDAVTFDVSVEPSTEPEASAEVSVSPSSVTVRGGGQATVRVTVTVTPTTELPTEGLQAASGTVVFTPSTEGPPALRTPYVLVHRSVSDLETRPRSVRVPRDGTVELTTRNTSPVPGTLDVYAWGSSDRRRDDLIRGGGAPDIRAVGVQAYPDAGPFPDEPTAAGVGTFAVNTYGRLGTASAAEYDVLLDVNEDGKLDFAVIGLDVGLVSVGAPTGLFASLTVDLESGEIIRALAAGGGLNSGTVTLSFVLSDVGVDEANPDFMYDAESYSLIGPGVDEVDGRAQYNAFDQPVETGQLFLVPGRSSVEWSAAVDAEQLRETPVLGWMPVYLQNRAGPEQADLIRLRGGGRR